MYSSGGTSLTQFINVSRIARANAKSNICLIDLTDRYQVTGSKGLQVVVNDDWPDVIQGIGLDAKPRMEV